MDAQLRYTITVIDVENHTVEARMHFRQLSNAEIIYHHLIINGGSGCEVALWNAEKGECIMLHSDN